jgi:hypothetical protein
VGEGTFGKVKLGKHILTGEKVKHFLFKILSLGSCQNFRKRQNLRYG